MARKWEIRTWSHQRSNFTFSLNLKCSKMPASLDRLKNAYDFHLFWNIRLQNLVWKFWRIRWDCLILLAPQPGLPWSYLARPGQSNIRQFRWFVLMYWNSKELDGTDQYLVGSIWQSRPDRENFNNFWKCNEAVRYFAYPAYPVYCGLSHARNREIWSLKFQSQKSPT